MPLRMQMSRPVYITRPLRPLRPAAQRAPARAPAQRPAGSTAGVQFPQPDLTPTGDPGTDFAKALNAMIVRNRQNQVANQLLNTQTPPRAGAVGPVVNPQTGQIIGQIAPSAGTAPQTGGVDEFNLRQQMAASDEAARQQALNDQYNRARIAREFSLARSGGGGGGGNASRWKQQLGGGQPGQPGAKGGKPSPLVANQYDPNADARADSFPQLQTDFDAQYGKGAYAKVIPNLANATTDDKGNTQILDAKGDPIMTLSPDQANYWINRYNAGLVNAGQGPAKVVVPGANPNAGKDAGTPENPYVPKTGLEIRSLPYNSYYKDPNTGQIGQKAPVQPTQQPTASAADLSAPSDQVASADWTGGFAREQAPNVQPTNLADVTPSNTPSTFDLGNAPTGGLPDQSQLADAIQKARTANALQGTFT